MNTVPPIFVSVGIYTQTRQLLPRGPTGSVVTGSLVGIALATIAHFSNDVTFPESKSDAKYQSPEYRRVFLKGIFGHAAFFTVFEGLKSMMRSQNAPYAAETEIISLNSLAAGVSGLVYKAVAHGFSKSPVSPNVNTALFLTFKTFCLSSLVGFGVGVYETKFGKVVGIQTSTKNSI